MDGCQDAEDVTTMPNTLFFHNHNYGHPHLPNGFFSPRGVVFLSDGYAWYSGVNFGGSITRVSLNEPDWSSIKVWIAKCFGDSNPTESDYKPGTSYKRIYWPFASSGNLRKAIDEVALTQSFVALRLLLTKMQEIFQCIEPAPANVQSYGHKIRELLLLAAMEVEASCAAVLTANKYLSTARMTTNDYVKLLSPMLLDSYSLTLASYPDFPSFAPFEHWSSTNPTQSLGWYHAYNMTKHNREEYLNVATLEKAVHAVGAAVVMFYAQFGFSFGTGDDKIAAIRSVFRVSPDYERYPTSCYIPNVKSCDDEAGVISWDWELLDYAFPQ